MLPLLDRPTPLWINSIFPLIVLAFPVAVFIAIYRHLFNIEGLVRQGLLYAALTTLLVLVFYGTLGAGGFLFSQFVGGEKHSLWVTSASTLMLGVLFAPLRRWLLPLLQEDRLVGIMALGRPETGSALPVEQLDFLTLLAHHVAISLENVRLFNSATYEGLTGLPRREAILDLLDKELIRAQRYQRPLTVAFADLGHFSRPRPFQTY